MTPAERTTKIAELRAEADRLEREGALPALTLEWCDEIWRNCPRGISIAESVKWVIEQDRARIIIKTPDAPEPTGAELVGKVCDFSDNGVDWTMGSLWTGNRGGSFFPSSLLFSLSLHKHSPLRVGHHMSFPALCMVSKTHTNIEKKIINVAKILIAPCDRFMQNAPLKQGML